jgi:flagellar hook-associated protein 1 FlgK
MGSLTTALVNSASALQVYDQVFNVIENNVTNANTPGYVDQNLSLVASAGAEGGLVAGPLVSSRSTYLDQAVRTQTEQLGNAQQTASDLSQIQALFDTTGQAGVPGALTAFFSSVSQLSVNPNDQPSRQSVITAAQGVAQQFNQNAIGIQQTSSNVNAETSGTVASINNMATQIATVNQQYQNTPDAAQNPGLDAQLNSALDQLSQLVSYTAIKTSNGTYNVYIGGQTPLVMGAQSYAISANFSSAQTAIDDSQGNDITAELQNNGGTLGSTLQTTNVTLPGYMSSLNTIAQTFADTVNTALSQGVDSNGNPPAVNLFQYNAAQGVAATLSITDISPAQIAAASATAPGGNGNALAIARLANQPEVNGSTYTQAYGALGGQVGQDIATAQQEQTTQQNLVDQAQETRSAATGVSLDAEAAQMIQFQQAYQAAGELVATLDTMTQTLITMVQAAT